MQFITETDKRHNLNFILKKKDPGTFLSKNVPIKKIQTDFILP